MGCGGSHAKSAKEPKKLKEAKAPNKSQTLLETRTKSEGKSKENVQEKVCPPLAEDPVADALMSKHEPTSEELKSSAIVSSPPAMECSIGEVSPRKSWDASPSSVDSTDVPYAAQHVPAVVVIAPLDCKEEFDAPDHVRSCNAEGRDALPHECLVEGSDSVKRISSSALLSPRGSRASSTMFTPRGGRASARREAIVCQSNDGGVDAADCIPCSTMLTPRGSRGSRGERHGEDGVVDALDHIPASTMLTPRGSRGESREIFAYEDDEDGLDALDCVPSSSGLTPRGSRGA